MMHHLTISKHNPILHVISNKHQVLRLTNNLCKVLVNIDGLPLSKSSVALVGVYHGHKKPDNSNLFLEDFVEEATLLTQNGFIFKDVSFTFAIEGFVCDVPAKSFVKCIKSHTVFFSCSKCDQEGEYMNNTMCPTAKDRTEEDFLNKKQPEHHTGTSILENLPNFAMISSFPLDYMHLICLGVMKKLLVGLWCNGKSPYKLSFRHIERLSENLVSQSHNIPFEFCRKPRTIFEAKQWKATEFRQFLFYTGCVVLKTIMPKDSYLNFLTLHASVTILGNPKSTSDQIEYANSLMEYFVKTFITIYGKEFVSHNVHNLLHLSGDVKKYGCFDMFSAFPFENFMQVLLKFIRKPDNPIPQIVKRFCEAEKSNENILSSKRKYKLTKSVHSEGPIVGGCGSPQYLEYEFQSFIIRTSHPNNYCGLRDGSIIEVKNFASKNDQVFVIGQKYNRTNDFYLEPCPSSYLGIFEVSELGEMECWPVTEINIKFVSLTSSECNVFVPLLHSET